MITLTLDLTMPPPWGDGSRCELDVPLHEGYGDDAAVAHEIVAAGTCSDDDWVRLVDADGELWGVPRPWLLGWRTRWDPSPGS